MLEQIQGHRQQGSRGRARGHRQRHIHPRQSGEPRQRRRRLRRPQGLGRAAQRARARISASILERLNGELQGVPQAFAFALPPPPIQGIGNVGGFTMQVELRNGNFDYALLQTSGQRRRRATPTRNRRFSGSPRHSARARRKSLSMSTASRPRRSASPLDSCSPPSPTMSDRTMSARSPSSATSSRSMRRRRPNIAPTSTTFAISRSRRATEP